MTGARNSPAGTTTVPLAGRYRLVSPIAAGAVGEVWRGADLVLARPVAVKLLRAEHAQHAETLARFRAEARHSGSLAHPGIAQVYDYRDGGEGHPPFLVLELVDGPSLAGLLDGGPLAPASVMDLVAQAATALHAAHQAGLVHRDIKPGNLLLGPGGRVKITDFGIAHAAGSAPLTRTGALIGTPAYLAPERVAGASAAPASDLYSLGIVAWECLAGAPPFRGMAIEVALAHRDRPLPLLPDAVPGEVDVLVAEMTAKDPGARPPAVEVANRAGALRDALVNGAAASLNSTQPCPVTGAQPETVADPQPATLLSVPLSAEISGPQFGPGRPRLSWRLVASALAGAVGLALLLVLLAGVLGSAPRPSARPSPRHSPAARAGRLVEVNADALIGQPVRAAARLLQQLGLRVRVLWEPAHQPPATVVSVLPGGRVRVGSAVVVTGALAVHHKPEPKPEPAKPPKPRPGPGKKRKH